MSTPADRGAILPHGRFILLFVALSGTAVLTSTLQGTFFALQVPRSMRTAMLVLIAAINVVLAIQFLNRREGKKLLSIVILLYLTQMIVFAIHLWHLNPPLTFRLLQVALVLFYAASIVMTLLVGLRILAAEKAILLSLSIALSFLVAESILGAMGRSANKEQMPLPLWVGNLAQHPTLGVTYIPYSTIRTFYPDNPRGYFEEARPGENQWWLRTAGGNEAKLVLPKEQPEIATVVIDMLESKADYDVQLNQSHFKVSAQHEYEVSFRAKSEKPRALAFGFARSHAPWDNLGFYTRINLTQEWQHYKQRFSATDDDENARIHFDVASDQPSIDFTDVTLRSIPDGAVIRPTNDRLPYVVSYEFNAMGCRGGDYVIPKPQGTSRILFLGDSYTLGVGVHNRDTVASKLQQIFDSANGINGRKTEVINCGVSGYGTKEERLFYELFGTKYQPDVVLLVMVWNDDLSFGDEVQNGYVNRNPGKLEQLFLDWRKVQDYRHQRPSTDFSRVAEEVALLDQEVKKQGARFGVVIFRNDNDYAGSTEIGRIWNRLTSAVSAKMQQTKTPLLDLGESLYQKSSGQDLRVHPVVDEHPNEIAHSIASREIFDFLRSQKLVLP